MLIQCFQRPGSPTTLSMSGYEYKFRDNYKYGDVEIPAGSYVCNIQNREHVERLLSFDHFKEYKPVVPEQVDEWKDAPRVVSSRVDPVEENTETTESEEATQEAPKNKGGRPKKVK